MKSMSDLKKVTLGGSLLICFWVPMVALIIWGKGGVLDLLEIRQEVANLEAEIKTLQKGNQLLAEDVKRFETDPSAYEGPARHLLLKKKAGEIVLYLPQDGGASVKKEPLKAGQEPEKAVSPPPVKSPQVPPAEKGSTAATEPAAQPSRPASQPGEEAPQQPPPQSPSGREAER